MLTDDELNALRAAAEAEGARPGAWPFRASPFSVVDTYIASAYPATILRLLAHVDALTARVAERDDLLLDALDAIYLAGYGSRMGPEERATIARIDAALCDGPEAQPTATVKQSLTVPPPELVQAARDAKRALGDLVQTNIDGDVCGESASTLELWLIAETAYYALHRALAEHEAKGGGR
jgi:hypothetical protein